MVSVELIGREIHRVMGELRTAHLESGYQTQTGESLCFFWQWPSQYNLRRKEIMNTYFVQMNPFKFLRKTRVSVGNCFTLVT